MASMPAPAVSWEAAPSKGAAGSLVLSVGAPVPEGWTGAAVVPLEEG